MRSEPSEHHITVARTARYFTIGDPAATEIWFVCHGYGQLAARFLKRFEPITEGARLVVAPEGLSRFYVGSGERRDQPVGATWMTREDRLHEIADYVKYLDAVYADVVGDGPAPGRVRALGFSQGAATAGISRFRRTCSRVGTRSMRRCFDRWRVASGHPGLAPGVSKILFSARSSD